MEGHFMRKLFFPILAAAILLAVALLSVHAATETTPTVGQTAPGFTLPSQDSSQISLENFRGKWVVLYFYPRDMTPGCTIEAHNFQRDLPKFEAQNAVILGVSVDTPDSHRKFCNQEGLTFRLLADPDHAVVNAYGSLSDFAGVKIASRNTFLIDPKGMIAKVWTNVSVQHHSEEVLAAITELKE
jgi:thioredoxin-dependent peroxiredoxin